MAFRTKMFPSALWGVKRVASTTEKVAGAARTDDEVRKAISELSKSKVEMLRLKKLTWASCVIAQLDFEDLLHEAYRKALESNPAERRNWPPIVEPVTFFAGVISSLASNEYGKRKRRSDSLFKNTVDILYHENEAHRPPTFSIQDIVRIFEGNDTAVNFILDCHNGENAETLRKKYHLDENAYAALRKRIVRKIKSCCKDIDR